MVRMLRNSLFPLVAALAVTLVMGGPLPSRASTQHAPNGIGDFMAGVLPPPGFYWLNYIGVVEKDTLRDDGGDKVPGADLDARVVFDAFRFVYMTPVQILGANYGAQVIVPVYTAEFKVNTPGGRLKSDASGVGDITVDPCILAWHFSPNFHMAVGIDVILPTGNYDKDEVAATIMNKNLVTIEPVLVVSYWVPGGFDLSAKINYDVNLENGDPSGGAGKVEPGDEFHFDWAVSHALTADDEWRAGVVGYYYGQLTKDKVDGSTAGQELASTMALGAAVKYWPKMGPLSFTAKYYSEFGGENIAEGSSLWLNFTWAL